MHHPREELKTEDFMGRLEVVKEEEGPPGEEEEKKAEEGPAVKIGSSLARKKGADEVHVSQQDS